MPVNGGSKDDPLLREALDTFSLRLESILNSDTASLARTDAPFRAGDALSAQQQGDLQDAAKELLEQVPLGHLAPRLIAHLEHALRQRGITAGLDDARLSDFGSAGAELALSLVNALRTESPGFFYGVGAAAAAAIGYLAWEQGTAGLRQLGITPELKVRLFDSQLGIGAAVDFDPHFENISGKLAADVSISGQAHGVPDFRLGAEVKLAVGGKLESVTAKATVATAAIGASAEATVRGKALETLSGRLTLTPRPDFSLSAAAAWHESDQRLTASAEATWKLSRDVELAASVSHDSKGETRGGVGARVRFW